MHPSLSGIRVGPLTGPHFPTNHALPSVASLQQTLQGSEIGFELLPQDIADNRGGYPEEASLPRDRLEHAGATLDLLDDPAPSEGDRTSFDLTHIFLLGT